MGIAFARPNVVSADGWMPWASSRSSSIASWKPPLGSREERGAPLWGSLQLVAGFVQPEGERREALLRAVVEIALEPPPFRVGRVDEPRAEA